MINVSDNSITFQLDKSLYSKDAIFKCIYWYNDRFSIEVKDSPLTYNIHFEPKNTEPDLRTIALKIEQDFNDFNLRDIVSKETQNVRDLLIAKAFSHFDDD